MPHAMTAVAAPHPRLVVVIPVRNEEARIGACLDALARQHDRLPDRVVLLLNGCTDSSEARVREITPSLGIHIDIAHDAGRGDRTGAGHARSLAFRHGAEGLGDRDILMTTDADGQVCSDWVGANLAALQRGADVVCGRSVIDPHEARSIPPHLHEDDAREGKLASLLEQLACLIDPEEHDPWPRHSEHSGASIACTMAAWRQAGGIPRIHTGEDRGFIDALRRIDARIRHEPSVRVTVSGRTQGRAAGGMAETIRRRMMCQDEFIDDALEPALDRHRRICLRAHARALWEGARSDCEALAAALDMPERTVRHAIGTPYFGTAWATLERACVALRPRRVRFIDLPGEIATAASLCAHARAARTQPAFGEAA